MRKMCILCFVWLLALWVGAAPPKDLSVSALAWSEDGAMLAVGSNNGDVTLYSGEGPRLKLLPRQVGAIRGLYWRGQELISVSSDGTIRSSARLDPLLNAGYLSKVERGGSRLALFGYNGLQIFDLEQDRIIARAKMPLEQSAEFAIDPQGGYLSVKEPEACVLANTSLLYQDRDESAKSVTIPVPATEFAGDNSVLKVGARSQMVTYSGERVITFELPRKYCQVYAINPRRTLLLAVGLSDGGMRLFPLYK